MELVIKNCVFKISEYLNLVQNDLLLYLNTDK